MAMHFVFIVHVLRLAPLFLLIRGIVLLLVHSLRRRSTILHELGVIAFWLYLAAVCYNTVNIIRILQGHFEMGSNYNLIPFAEIRGIAASPDTVYALLNIVGNVVMFAPLGFLLPLLWRRWRGMQIFLTAMLTSCGIEVLQLFTGRSADVDDVILNTLGGVCGYLCFLIVRLILPGFTGRFRLRDRGKPAEGPQLERMIPSNAAQISHPRTVLSRKEQVQSYRRTALTVTAVALCALVSGAVLLNGLIFSFATTSGTVQRPGGPVLEIPHLNSESILLVADDNILYEKNADQRIYPASMTKIMTAVLVLDFTEDLQQPVHLRADIFPDIYSANLATAGFLPGEEAAVIDFLYGLMLPSGAECAVGLAEHVAGSEKEFAVLMNAKAGELGMYGTHFTNATGRHEWNHYATAADLALLMRYALENLTFRAIASSAQYSTSPTNLHKDGITFYSTLLGRVEDTVFPAGVLLGGKTGYTDEAGQCLASFAQAGGKELILVTAGAKPEDYRTQQLHIEDALTVYSALN